MEITMRFWIFGGRGAIWAIFSSKYFWTDIAKLWPNINFLLCGKRKTGVYSLGTEGEETESELLNLSIKKLVFVAKRSVANSCTTVGTNEYTPCVFYIRKFSLQNQCRDRSLLFGLKNSVVAWPTQHGKPEDIDLSGWKLLRGKVSSSLTKNRHPYSYHILYRLLWQW